MSLVAFCFMGGGGVGTAMGAGIIRTHGLENLFLAYCLALFGTLILSFALIRGHVVPVNQAQAMTQAK